MIPIQVLGVGLIPRGYGLAPRLKPFMADRLLIGTIMTTPGLTVNFVNPESGATTKLTSKNMDRIIQKWDGWTSNAKAAAPARTAQEQDKVTGITPDGKAVYKGEVVTGGINPNSRDFINPPPAQEEKKAETTSATVTPPAEETKADENKSVGSEAKTEDKKAEEPAPTPAAAEQKTTTDTTTTQKNNGFKPMGQNNQGKNNKK